MICYFYATPFEKAVEALPATAERVDTGADPWAYWWALASRWNSGEDLITIEQDIVVTASILSEFRDCDKPWCSFGYRTGPGNMWPVLTRGLGCTRISAELQKQISVEDILEVSIFLRMQCANYPRPNGCNCRPSALCWMHIDGPMTQAFSERAGLDGPHVHEAIVDHIHDW